MLPRWIAPAAALLVLAAGAAADTTPPAAQDLQRLYPGARVHMDEGRVRVLYGVPMTVGMTPQQAAEGFWAQHAAAFGVDGLELSVSGVTTVQQGRFTVYSYRQTINGMPVEFGNGRLLVLNQPVPRVVYAAGTFAKAPAGGFPEAVFAGAPVKAAIQALPAYRDLKSWTIPTPAIYQAAGGVGVRVWKFEGSRPGRAFTFFVDMASGILLEARSEIYNDNVTGTVKAMATPGLDPDFAGNDPVAIPISNLKMTIQGGNNAFSDINGDFDITHGGTAPVTLLSNASSARWVDVNPTGSPELTVSIPATPGTPAAPMFNTSPGGVNSQLTAQANVLIHGQRIHDYFLDRAPGFTEISKQIAGNTGVAGQCNAFYQSTDDSINFFNVGGGCNNSAYSTVIAHEYGHFCVNERNLSQGAFGEGFSDTAAVMLYDTGIIAKNFYQTGAPIRDLVNNTRSYPCSGGGHDCGEVLGAFYWRVIQNFKNTYGNEQGLTNARELHVAWFMMTTGGNGGNAMHPATVIEVLTVDDTDGNLANGTPNYAEICAASATRNLPCPPLTPFEILYPSGRPEILTSGEPAMIPVEFVGVASTPVAGTGKIHYSINGGAFTADSMVEVSPNRYEATIPATECTDVVNYYFSGQAASGATVRDPAGAPAESFEAVSAVGSAVAANHNFEVDPGWTVTNAVSDGGWERGVPAPLPNPIPSNVHAAPFDSDGSGQCWVTGLALGHDVDGGTAVLMTNAMDLSAYDTATLSFDLWFETIAPGPQTPPNPSSRSIVIQISANDGMNWTSIGFFGNTDTVKQWLHKEFEVTDYVALTDKVRVRFSVTDNGTQNYDVEAGVDAFKVLAYTCESLGCYPDCNGDGSLNLSDFGCFTTKFALGEAYADCNGDGVRNLSDFGCFTTKFALGCP